MVKDIDLYHSWIYVHILNAEWFVWSVVLFTFAANILSPILIWFIFRGKKVIGEGGAFTGWYFAIRKKHL